MREEQPELIAGLVEKAEEYAEGVQGVDVQALVARAQEKEHWLEEWWDDIAYLGYRDSVSIAFIVRYHIAERPTRAGRRQRIILLCVPLW